MQAEVCSGPLELVERAVDLGVNREKPIRRRLGGDEGRHVVVQRRVDLVSVAGDRERDGHLDVANAVA